MSNLALVMVKRYQRAAEYIRFIDGDAANYAIKLLRKQPYVNYAIRMTDEPTRAMEAFIEKHERHHAACHLTYLLSQ